MHNLQELISKFKKKFSTIHFPSNPETLYTPCNYFLKEPGKQIRPTLAVLANELYTPSNQDTWNLAIAIELFHNFTLVHDDIMDNASFRRGRQTLHEKYNKNTAILSGDIMIIKSYEYLNKIKSKNKVAIISSFNQMATEVCEGQQLDLDFESQCKISMKEYNEMIRLKTCLLYTSPSPRD